MSEYKLPEELRQVLENKFIEYKYSIHGMNGSIILHAYLDLIWTPIISKWFNDVKTSHSRKIDKSLKISLKGFRDICIVDLYVCSNFLSVYFECSKIYHNTWKEWFIKDETI